MALRHEGIEVLEAVRKNALQRLPHCWCLINGSEKLKLVFDCKPCEMHVVGKLKRNVVQQRAREIKTVPMKFYTARP